MNRFTTDFNTVDFDIVVGMNISIFIPMNDFAQ